MFHEKSTPISSKDSRAIEINVLNQVKYICDLKIKPPGKLHSQQKTPWLIRKPMTLKHHISMLTKVMSKDVVWVLIQNDQRQNENLSIHYYQNCASNRHTGNVLVRDHGFEDHRCAPCGRNDQPHWVEWGGSVRVSHHEGSMTLSLYPIWMSETPFQMGLGVIYAVKPELTVLSSTQRNPPSVPTFEVILIIEIDVFSHSSGRIVAITIFSIKGKVNVSQFKMHIRQIRWNIWFQHLSPD